MHMRLSIAILAAAAASAALSLRPAHAQGPSVETLVRVDFRNSPGEDRAIAELERQLNDFRDDVRRRDRGRALTFGPFRVEGASGLARNPLGEWKAGTIAMVWGHTVQASARLVRPTATLFIGPLRIQPMLRRRANSFRSLYAMVALSGNRDNDVGTYANFIGYAILLRTWSENPSRAGTIASALEARIPRDYGGPNASSECLDDLLTAVKLIGLWARGNRAPRADNLTSLLPIDCEG